MDNLLEKAKDSERDIIEDRRHLTVTLRLDSTFQKLLSM